MVIVGVVGFVVVSIVGMVSMLVIIVGMVISVGIGIGIVSIIGIIFRVFIIGGGMVGTVSVVVMVGVALSLLRTWGAIWGVGLDLGECHSLIRYQSPHRQRGVHQFDGLGYV